MPMFRCSVGFSKIGESLHKYLQVAINILDQYLINIEASSADIY